MKEEKKNTILLVSVGVTSAVAFIILMILKLTKIITWSWWFVTLPLWGPVGLLFIFILIVVAVFIVIIIFTTIRKKIKDKKNKKE